MAARILEAACESATACYSRLACIHALPLIELHGMHDVSTMHRCNIRLFVVSQMSTIATVPVWLMLASSLALSLSIALSAWSRSSLLLMSRQQKQSKLIARHWSSDTPPLGSLKIV